MAKSSAVLDALPNAALLIATSGRIEVANRKADALFGQWALGRSYVMVLRQPDVRMAIEKVIENGGSAKSTYRHSLGDITTTFSVHIQKLDETAGPSLVLVHFEDVSALSEAALMRRGFVANVSHELKTPLTALMGFIETLQGPAKDDPTAQKHFLALMAREADRMHRLVRDLLSLSRVEAQGRSHPNGLVDFARLIPAALASLDGLAEKSGVTVQLDAPKSVHVAGDADQLTQIVTNLVENALKYGGNDVHVSLFPLDHDPQLRGPVWAFQVTDTGAGIAPDHLSRLTERFYRVDGHRNRDMGGTGLGLAIVKHIVQRHRGRLQIESTLGQGSCFTALLPAPKPGVASDKIDPKPQLS